MPRRSSRIAPTVTAVTLAAALAAAGGLPAGAANETAVAGPGDRLSAANRAFVDKAVQDAMDGNRLPGVSLAMTGPKGKYRATYGVANRTSGRPLTTADHVRIASISKTFTATAVLLQIERGTIRFGDKLSQWVKGIPHGRHITVRQLLAMRSGIFDFTSDERFLRQFTRNPQMAFNPKRVIAIIKRHEPAFEPGERTQYADSNYVLLGIILRKVTRTPVHEVIMNDVVRPAGLGHTYVPTGPGLPRPFARGYFAGDAGTGPIRDYTFLNPLVPFTAGNMISTLGNLQRWGKILAEGTLLTPRMQRQRLRFGMFPNPGGPKAGYGLGILRFGDWIGHDGAIFGFSTITMVNRKTGAQFTATANLSSNFSTPTLDLFAVVVQELYPSSLRP